MQHCNCGDSLRMIAGTSFDVCFHITFLDGILMPAAGTTAEFSICHYSDVYMEPTIIKPCVLAVNKDKTIDTITASLLPSDTVALQTGKYRYKLKITDCDNGVDVPSHGFLFIERI